MEINSAVNIKTTADVNYNGNKVNSKSSKKTEFSDMLKNVADNTNKSGKETKEKVDTELCVDNKSNKAESIIKNDKSEKSTKANALAELILLILSSRQLQQSINDDTDSLSSGLGLLGTDSSTALNNLSGISISDSLLGGENNSNDIIKLVEMLSAGNGQVLSTNNNQTENIMSLINSLSKSENFNFLEQLAGNKESAIEFTNLLQYSTLLSGNNTSTDSTQLLSRLSEILDGQDLSFTGNSTSQLRNFENYLKKDNLSFLHSLNSLVSKEDSNSQIINDSLLYSELKDLVIKDNSINDLVMTNDNQTGTLKTEKTSVKGFELEDILNNSANIQNPVGSNNNVNFETLNKLSEMNEAMQKNVLNQVKDQIILMRDKGIDTVTMKLNPESLGKLDIKMIFDKGVLNVEITASNPKTQSLLLSNLDEIKSILENTQDKAIINFNNEKDMPENYQDNQNHSNQQERENNEQNKNYQQEKYEQTVLNGIDFFDELANLRQSIEYI